MAQYGQIIQNQTAGVINHALGTNFFCAFLTQFANGGVGANGTPRMYISGQSATQVVLTNPGAAMAADVILVSPMSVLDVGPIVAGTPTRLATETTPYLASKGLWSYRSLHQFVPVQLVQGAAVATVDITHLLNTPFTTAFVTPRFDPWDTNAGIMWYTQAVPSANTIRIGFARQDAGVFVTATRWVSFDVMVLARLDPTGNDLAFSVLRHNPAALSRVANYHADFDAATIAQAGTAFVHNLNGVATSALIQFNGNPVGTTANYISARDSVANTTSILAATGNPGGVDCSVRIIRGHSRLMGP